MVLWLALALADPLSADDAARRAIDRAVDVAAADASFTVAEGGARATAWFREDPRVQGRLALLGDVAGASISQPVSFTGEGLAAHRGAKADVAEARARQIRARLEVAAAARLAWVAAVEARQRVALTVEALDLARRLREGADARYERGDASLLDDRLARLQEAEARAVWMAAIADEGERLAELTAWTGVPVADLELPDDPLQGLAAVVLEGTGARSDQAAAREAVDAARARLARQRAAVLPPVRLGAFVEQEEGDLRAGPTVQLTVPVWHRNADGRAQAQGELAVAEARLAERDRVVDAEQDARRAVVVQLEAGDDGSNPRAEARAALESVGVGYDEGELDLVTAGLLRQQILSGQQAWLRGRRVRAEARIVAALAFEAAGLLGP